jgi:type I restriction-modification system DNA methylase subunit
MIQTAREGTGRIGVVVPHGVLFRGATEGRIRQKLIQENLLEAVIGLPANLFFGTGIPAAILLFNKAKTHGDVLFIDASREFADAKNQNLLTDAHVDKIVRSVSSERLFFRPRGALVPPVCSTPLFSARPRWLWFGQHQYKHALSLSRPVYAGR